MNGLPAGSRDPSSQVSTGQKDVQRGAQEVVQVDSGSEAEAPDTTTAEAQGEESTGTGEVPMDSFDMQACLNRGHPMVVEWDGRERDFIDGFWALLTYTLASCFKGDKAYGQDEETCA